MKVDYIINKTIPVNPKNKGAITLEINHDQSSVIDQAAPHVGINNLFFAREDVDKLMDIVRANGLTEGIPFDIRLKSRGQKQEINMYIDLMEGLKRSNDGVSVTVKMLQSLDWLDDKVDGFTFESMYNETGVKPFTIDGVKYSSYQEYFDKKCIFVPYVISTIPNYRDAFMALFGITFVGTQLYQVSKTLAQWTVPQAGFGLVLGVAQLLLEIAYATLLIITLISLIQQLINSLIQPIKYHGAMLMSDLLKVTAAKLGLTATSSIFDQYPFNQLAYLPQKYNPFEGTPSKFSIMGVLVEGFTANGYTSPALATGVHNSETSGIQKGYFNGTGGDFLRLAKMMCNGKYVVPDGLNELQLERRDYYPSSASYQMPPIRQDWNGYNTDEMVANIMISFLNDLNEQNVANNNYQGTRLQATHAQVVTTDKRLVSLKGIREVQIEAARGVAKTKLTFVEQAVLDLSLVWDVITTLENIGIAAINIAIGVANAVIATINIIIAVWNTIIDVLHVVTDIINVISDALDTIGLGFGHIDIFDNGKGKLGYLKPIDPVSFASYPSHNFNNRLNTLLLENDIVDTPKILLIDTARTEFVNNRIGYLHQDNLKVVNASYLWEKFYFIDAFVGAKNNRYTLINPALNSPDEKNECLLDLAGFKKLVSNPLMNDPYSEPVIADSVLWNIETGVADFSYRKAGWLSNPQSNKASERKKEINTNLQIKISLPNGQ